MARSRSRRKPLPAPVRVTIESLGHDGRGIARVEGKTVFVDGALAGEEVEVRYVKQHRNFDEAAVEEVITPSPLRVEPRCPHFSVCGGCSLQHMAEEQQIEAKQAVLLDNLARLGKVKPAEVLRPLTGPHWGYRRKARLSVKHVRKKGKVLVGFREKHSPYVAEIDSCAVLHPAVGERIEALAAVIESLRASERIAQIEVAVADNATALVFRNLDPLSEEDQARLCVFGQEHDVHIYLQPGGPETVSPLCPTDSQLFYRLHDFGLELGFGPTDFTQVNFDINRDMLIRALDLLQLGGDERVLDLFCGIGNFTLPIATRAAEVVGVEGAAASVERAADNARRNGIENVGFHVANLADDVSGAQWAGSYDRVLLDPPRAGALEVLPVVAATGASRIVYVSCHPGTLARDAGELVHRYGYRLEQAGVMDMFPHTAHVESIALFVK
jgi:23S rRNA (uracil1939-C5)-methyltransferase